MRRARRQFGTALRAHGVDRAYFLLHRLLVIAATLLIALLVASSAADAQTGAVDPPQPTTPATGTPANTTPVPPPPATTTPPPPTVPPATPATTPVPTTPAPMPAAGDAGAQQRSLLDTYLLRDSKGNLVPVIGMSFEDFEKLLRLQRQLAPPEPPKFSIDVVSLKGTADASQAKLSAKIEIRTQAAGRHPVPLRMTEAILLDEAKYEGPGELFLTFDAAAGGYVAWVTSKGAESHTISLNVATPISTVAGQSRLKLTLPRGTESSLRVAVAESRVSAELDTGSEGILSVEAVEAGGSEMAVLGAAGQVSMRWKRVSTGDSTARSILESSGELIVRVEGKNRISTDARLRVRSFGSAVESFRVRLPRGMELVPTSPVGYRVEVVSDPATSMMEADSSKRPAQVVEVRLDRPTNSVIEVRLLAALVPDSQNGGMALEPAEFDVLGAVRQRGTVDFVVEGDWNLSWTEDSSVRRIDAETDVASPARTAARFEYFRQPCKLGLTVASRPTRVFVEPSYVVYVDGKLLRLEATLKYRWRGTQPQTLSIDLGNWSIAKAEPDTVLDPTRLSREARPLAIPLRDDIAVPADFEIKLEAQQTLAENSSVVDFLLPRPDADIVTPASVTLLPADNVQLTPSTTELQGLLADIAASSARLPTRGQPALTYRDLSTGDPTRFVGTIKLLPRRTTLSSVATLSFARERLHVEQVLEFTVAHQSRQSFELLWPQSVVPQDLQLKLGEKLLSFTLADTADDLRSGRRRLVLDTGAPQLGKIDINATFSMPVPAVAENASVSFLAPLLTAAEEPNLQLLTSTVSARTSSEIRTTPLTIDEDLLSVDAARGDGVAWSVNLPSGSSPLEIQLAPLEAVQQQLTTTDKMWLQTWLSPSGREDRAVWQLTTSASSVTFRLPTITASNILVLVDGKQTTFALQPSGVLKIDVPSSSRTQERVIELWYTLGTGLSSSGYSQRTLDPPTMVEAPSTRRFFWQLCLPESQLLLVDPPGYGSQTSWQQQGPWWSRRSSLSQRDLEDWIAATHQDQLPPALQQSLYADFGKPRPLVVTVISRRLLILIVSGLVVLVGLAILQLTWARHPSLLLVAGITIFAASAMFPYGAFLAAQAAMIGMAAMVATSLFAYLTSGRVFWITPAAVPRKSVSEVRTRGARPPVAASGSHTTTATAAAGLGASEIQP